jgi:hypothetical protein
MTSHDSRLPEQSGVNEDAAMTRLTAALDNVYGRAAAPPALHNDIRRLSLQHAVTGQKTDNTLVNVRYPHRLSRTWRAIVGLGIAAILLLAGSALAGGSLFKDAMNMFPGLSQATTTSLGTGGSLAQTVCGYTMTINRAYADANRIVVAYSLSGPAERNFDNIAVEPGLEDSQGQPFQPVVGGGTGVQDNQSGNVITYDQTILPLTGDIQTMRLTVPSVTAEEVISGPVSPPASCESAAPVQTADGTTTRQIIVPAPLIFNLEVPLDRRVRQTAPNESRQSVHGTTVTLDRIVVTPSETKIYLRVSAGPGTIGGPAIAPILYVDGKEIDDESTVDENGEIVATYDAALYDNHGVWSLTVLTDPVMANNSRSYSGTVTFVLNVP